MRRRAATAIATAALLLLSTAPSASAQEETGTSCVANASAPNWTLIGFDPRQIFPVPLYELQTRVITNWQVQVAPGVAPIAQQLIALQQVGEVEDRKAGESAIETLSEGANEFPTRIPISGYHPHVGLHGPVRTLYCAGEEKVLAGVVEGEFATDETRRYKIEVGIGAPVTVTVEPDRDGDGYGDLTQDLCPQAAAVQLACPAVSVRASAVAKGKSIRVQVGVSSEAQVEVFGQVGWGYRPKPGMKTTRIIAALSGPKRSVTTGSPGFFKVPLPKIVQRRLAKLTPRESLKAKVEVSVKDLADRETIRRLTVKLRGWRR
jgi:hypothetical protein